MTNSTIERPLTVLIVDDDASLVDFFVEVLGEEGMVAEGETDSRRVLERLKSQAFDVVVADVEMPGLRGPDMLAAIQQRHPKQLVILMSAFGSIELAVKTLQAGAVDFLAKPFPHDALGLAIRRAIRERDMQGEIVRLTSLLEGLDRGDLVAQSPAMKRVVEFARRAARTQSAVLLTGESGVGKSSLASFIHRSSVRAKGPWVSLNCAALPVSLAEAELFGARKGAYTGASKDRAGLFVKASGGTLFLDEIGELALEIQPKLLEVLETGMVRPLGGTQSQQCDVRLVAATNASLEAAVEQRRFRSDLYFRLNVIRLEIPPLRERREDFPLLVDALMRRVALRVGRQMTGLSTEAMRLLMRHDWPGNVRELANVIERAVVMSEGSTLQASDIWIEAPTPTAFSGDFMQEAARRKAPLEEVERAYIRCVLEQVGGVKQEAARILGIDRRTLYRKLGEDD